MRVHCWKVDDNTSFILRVKRDVKPCKREIYLKTTKNCCGIKQYAIIEDEHFLQPLLIGLYTIRCDGLLFVSCEYKLDIFVVIIYHEHKEG